MKIQGEIGLFAQMKYWRPLFVYVERKTPEENQPEGHWLWVWNIVDDVDQQQTTHTIEKPPVLIKLRPDEWIYVQVRNDRELQGRPHAYDQHLNMILGDMEETVTTTETHEETLEEIYKSTKRNIPILSVWGEGVVLVAPILRVGWNKECILHGN